MFVYCVVWIPHDDIALIVTLLMHTFIPTQSEGGQSPRRGCSEERDALPMLIPLYNTAAHKTSAWAAFQALPVDAILGSTKQEDSSLRRHEEDSATNEHSNSDSNRTSNCYLSHLFRIALEEAG